MQRMSSLCLKDYTIWIVVLLLVVYGTGILLSAIFQDDPKTLGALAMVEGTLHSVFAMIAFFALVIGMVVFARIVYLNPAWCGFTITLLWVEVVSLRSLRLRSIEGSQESLI